MANYMEKVAHMLGVELDEEFKIKGDNSRYKFTKSELCYFNEEKQCWLKVFGLLEKILKGNYEIIKPILDEAEKEYLSNIIKPFRDRVKCITKRDYEMSYENEYIFIVFNDDGCMQITMWFPSFKKGTMYKGTEVGKEYSLEELGV